MLPCQFRRLLAAVLTATLLFLSPSRSNSQSPPANSATKPPASDLQQKLPRIAPLEPADALKSFQVADPFAMSLVAAEPLVFDPVAAHFDASGDLYVAEMRGYSENQTDSLGSVARLRDTNGDGVFDERTVVADQLRWPTAIFCTTRGILVADAPDLILLVDTNGDAVADSRTIIATGFGTSNVQGLVNSLVWGIDGRIHGAISSSGAKLTQPMFPNQPPLALSGRDFAIDPLTWKITATTGGGQHGKSISDWGDQLVCNNSDHLQLITMTEQHLARNPLVRAQSRASIAADGPQADVFRTSPVEPWRIIRTEWRVQGVVKGIVEGGGRASGYFTSATGVTLYRGNVWSTAKEGEVFVADVGSNLIHRKRLEDAQGTFTGHRIDERREVVTSTDTWFRPVQFVHAPDGNLLVLDMYRETIEHPNSIPPQLKQHLDLTSGNNRGRIYRLSMHWFKPTKYESLQDLDTPMLVKYLAHTNGWHRDTAARLLLEKQDPAAAQLLRQLVVRTKNPAAKVQAAHLLARCDALDETTLLLLLQHEHPRVVQNGIALAEPILATSPTIEKAMLQLARQEKSSPWIARQIALALGNSTSDERYEILASLAHRSSEVSGLLGAIQSAVPTSAGKLLATLSTPQHREKMPRELRQNLLAQLKAQQRADDFAIVSTLAGELAASGRADDEQYLVTLITELALPATHPLRDAITKTTAGKSETLIAAAIQRSVDDVLNPNLTEALRLDALVLASQASAEQRRAAIEALLHPSTPPALQVAAINIVKSSSDDSLAKIILTHLPSLAPQPHAAAMETLASRPAWATLFLAEVATGKLPLTEVPLDRLALWTSDKNESLAKLATQLSATLSKSSRGEIVAKYDQSLSLTGDAGKGHEVFRRVCASCHKVLGEGHEIGPNLAAMKARGPSAIVLAVMDPSREVNPQFFSYAALTTDGRTATGMLVSENATSITLRRAQSQSDTLLRSEIDQLRSTGKSLMPEGLERELTEQNLADLIAYIMSLP